MGVFDRKPNVEKLAAKRDLEGLIKVLLNKKASLRLKAAEALGGIKEGGAVQALIKALEDEDEDVQAETAKALGKIKDPRAVDPLIQALQKGGPRVNIPVIWALGEIKDKKAANYLIEATKRDEMEDKRIAGLAIVFGKVEKDKRRLELLLQAKREEYKEVRKQAAIALGKIGDARAVEPLIQALKNEEPDVRAGAVKALGELGDKRAVEPLIQTLKDYFSRAHQKVAEAPGAVEFVAQAVMDKDLDLRIPTEVEEALGKIGEAAVKSLNNASKDEEEGVREAAKKALGRIKAKEITKNKRQAKSTVKPNVEKLKEEKDIEGLIDALGYRKESVKVEHAVVRENAADALGEIGSKRAVEPLIKTLQDKAWGVQYTAIEALGNIADPRAIEPIKQCVIETDKERVRGSGIIVLDEVFNLSKRQLKEVFLKSKASMEAKKELM